MLDAGLEPTSGSGALSARSPGAATSGEDGDVAATSGEDGDVESNPSGCG